MPSDKQIEAATSAIVDKIKTDGFIGYREAVSIILTAAEQAEPAPDARSDAVKVVEDTYERYPKIMDRLAALEPAEPEVMCVGCEGKPSLGNSPCAVCGKQAAEPATDAEPVAYGVKASNTMRFSSVYLACDYEHEGLGSYRKDLIVPLYTRPPESRLREALERVTLGRCGSEVTIFCNDSEEADKLLDFLILTQEDGR